MRPHSASLHQTMLAITVRPAHYLCSASNMQVSCKQRAKQLLGSTSGPSHYGAGQCCRYSRCQPKNADTRTPECMLHCISNSKLKRLQVLLLQQDLQLFKQQLSRQSLLHYVLALAELLDAGQPHTVDAL